MSKPIYLFLFGLSLAIGISLGGYFIGQTMYNSKVAVNTAEAKGLAERRVKADKANWRLSFEVSGKKKEEVKTLFKKAEDLEKRILTLLKENGFEDNELKTGILSPSHREIRDHKKQLIDEKFTMSGSVHIETNRVDMVRKARKNINRLIAEGINISNHSPSYTFNGLNKIKPAMLKEATQNARIAAKEFADNAGAKVGNIRNARQGNFYIRDAGEDYGDSQKIEKDVRVVTTISFYLKN